MGVTQVYLNGEYLPGEQARISVMDRGFIFGDGVYEVMPAFDGRLFRFEQHMQRLDNSLRAIYMDNPLTRRVWREICTKLLIDVPEQSLYIHISRGVSERVHTLSSAGSPTVFVMSQVMNAPDHRQGVSAITHEDIRWAYCDVKATTLLACVLLRHRATLAGAQEAILIRDGELTEGAASNVFVVVDDVICTSAKTHQVLPGVTRDLLLELLDGQGHACQERRIDERELLDAQEIWLTSSTWELLAVVRLNGKSVGAGCPGKHYHRVRKLYQHYKETEGKLRTV